jgi:hypothetical protein
VPQPAETAKEWVYCEKIWSPDSQKCASWAVKKAALRVVKEIEPVKGYVGKAGKWRVGMLGLGRRV